MATHPPTVRLEPSLRIKNLGENITSASMFNTDSVISSRWKVIERQNQVKALLNTQNHQ